MPIATCRIACLSCSHLGNLCVCISPRTQTPTHQQVRRAPTPVASPKLEEPLVWFRNNVLENSGAYAMVDPSRRPAYNDVPAECFRKSRLCSSSPRESTGTYVVKLIRGETLCPYCPSRICPSGLHLTTRSRFFFLSSSTLLPTPSSLRSLSPYPTRTPVSSLPTRPKPTIFSAVLLVRKMRCSPSRRLPSSLTEQRNIQSMRKQRGTRGKKQKP